MTEPRIVSSAPSQLAKREAPVPALAPISLREHVGVVNHHRALIVAVALTVSLGGGVYAYSKAPVYEGKLLLSVPNLRTADQRDLLGAPLLSADRKTAMSESEMLRSRVILGPVVDTLRLDVQAGPKHLPVIGRALAAWNAGRFSWPALGGYTWGGERIDVGAFDVPPAFVGTGFVVTKLAGERFRLEERVTGFRMVGRVGTTLEGTVAGETLTLRIDRLAGVEGGQFSLQKNPRISAMESLLASMSVSELGKDSGMLSVSMRDSDPEQVKLILNEIGTRYMDFVRSQKNDRFEASLAVLKAQLPGLEKRVAIAEKRVEDFRRAHGTADLPEEIRLALGRYSDTQAMLADLRQKRAEMSTRLGDAHPLLLALDRQMLVAEREGNMVASDIRSTPSLSRELDRLSRRLDAESDIHSAVVRKIEELEVVAQDRSTSVGIVDEAVMPVEPSGSRKVILAFFVMIGIFLGIFAAFLRRMLFPATSA